MIHLGAFLLALAAGVLCYLGPAGAPGIYGYLQPGQRPAWRLLMGLIVVLYVCALPELAARPFRGRGQR